MRLDFFKKGRMMWAGILIFTLLFGFTAYNYLTDSKQSALGFVPQDYTSFVYIKNVPVLKEEIANSKNFKSLEDNYFYQDLKSRFSKNIDFFFFQADFNLEYFLSLIQGDLTIGKSKGRFFLSALLSAKAKAMETLFRIMPQENIQELSAASYKFYKITKNGKSYFYTFLNGYFLLTDSEPVLNDMVFSASKKNDPIDREMASKIGKKDFVIKIRISPETQILNLLPDFSYLTLHYKWEEGSFALLAGESGTAAKGARAKGDGYEFLKLSGYDTPLCYYKSTFDVGQILEEAKKTDRGVKQIEDYKNFIETNPGELAKKVKPGVFVAFNGFSYPSAQPESGRIIPETSLILEMADQLTSSDRELLVEKAKKSLEYFFGAEKWKETQNQPKKYQIFESLASEVSLLATQKFLMVSFSHSALENLVSHLDQINPSVYDRYSQTLNKNRPPSAYFYFNLTSFLTKLEPMIRFYTVSALQMDDEEYQKSFGTLLEVAKKVKPCYGSVFYQPEGKKFYGEIKPVE